VLIEVDGPHHAAMRRRADDEDRDLHWNRCGIPTIRVGHERARNPEALKERLREDLRRHLFPAR
jgi:very-short-patch-repair endonuclease